MLLNWTWTWPLTECKYLKHCSSIWLKISIFPSFLFLSPENSNFFSDLTEQAFGINLWNFLYFNYLQMRNVLKTKNVDGRVSCQIYLLGLANDLHFQTGGCWLSKSVASYETHRCDWWCNWPEYVWRGKVGVAQLVLIFITNNNVNSEADWR